MEVNSRPMHIPDLVWRTMDDEMVIIRPGDGAIRVLNTVGAFIWNEMDGIHTIDDLVERVCAEYEVEAEEARSDLVEFLQDLVTEGFVTL